MHLQVTTTIPFGSARQNCYLCNGAQRQKDDGSRERMIDTGVHIDFEGHVAICETCATHMGKALGMLEAADVEGLAAELAAALELAVAVTADRDELKRVVEAQRVLLGHATAAEAEPGADDPEADDPFPATDPETGSESPLAYLADDGTEILLSMPA